MNNSLKTKKELILQAAREIGAQQLPRLYLQRIWLALGFQAFGGCEFREGAQVVFGLLQAGIGRYTLGGDHDCGVDGVSGGLRRALENGEQDFGLTSLISFLHLLGAIYPAVGNLKAERESGVAV